MPTAEEWLAANHPDQLADFPSERAGTHGDREIPFGNLDQLSPFEAPVSPLRKQGRKSFDFARRQAIASQAPEIARLEAERQKALADPLCSHCHAYERESDGAIICAACRVYRARTGNLPGPKIVERRQRKMFDGQ